MSERPTRRPAFEVTSNVGLAGAVDHLAAPSSANALSMRRSIVVNAAAGCARDDTVNPL